MAKCVKLNDGREIPIVGLGTYSRGDSKSKCEKAVEIAIKCGYRHVDTASFYGNERQVGAAVDNMISKKLISREDIFITTKIWNDCHDYDKVIPSLRDSLSKLNMEYVDLYLIHWPIGLNNDGTYSDVDYLETWSAMEKCREMGLAKSIGVSNFNVEQLDRLLKACKVKPVVNQVEVNVNLTQKKLIEYCTSKGIVVTAYSPFGAMVESKHSDSSPPPHINDPLLTEIAKKYNKTTSQVVLRFLVDIGCVVIPKSSTPERIAQNLDIFDFTLTAEEISKIDNFNCGHRNVAVSFWDDHKFYPF